MINGVIRGIGHIFIVLATLLLGLAVWLWLDGADIYHSAGQLWYNLHVASLNLSQALIQRYVSSALWDDFIVNVILVRPAWEAFGGSIFVLLVTGGVILRLTRAQARRKYSGRG